MQTRIGQVSIPTAGLVINGLTSRVDMRSGKENAAVRSKASTSVGSISDQRQPDPSPAARRDPGHQRGCPEVRDQVQRQLLRHRERGTPGHPLPGQRGDRPGQRQRPDLLPVRARTPRRLAALASLALAASAVQVVATAAPAQAAGCQAETTLGMCDDVTPPDTTLVAVRPAPTQAGYVRQSTVTFDFAGVAVDSTDGGQIAFECQLYNTAAPPTAWQACVSGQPFSGLADTAATPYTFRVRAVDATDAAGGLPDAPVRGRTRLRPDPGHHDHQGRHHRRRTPSSRGRRRTTSVRTGR